MNATGGWTAIDEELDATSTNPVQNKTLYNLETYHTLTTYEVGTSKLFLCIDGNKSFNVKAGSCINLYAEDPISVSSSKDISDVRLFNDGYSYDIIVNNSIFENVIKNITTNSTTNGIYPSEKKAKLTYLSKNNFIKDGNGIGYEYGERYFTTGNVFLKLFFTGEEFIIVNNPVLIKYERYLREYKDGVQVNYMSSKSIKYANELKMQWFQNVRIKGSGGSCVVLPLQMDSSDYTITEARKGTDLSDVTGYSDKYKGYFFVDTENDHVADFFVIGY